jgi:catechol 2,3-dioxygenase-like lactoylglutathione lyase family enzyme
MGSDGEDESMSRVQLALNVDDVDEAVAFYSTLFGVAPAKRRPGYANFAIEQPALKLVLIENPGAGGSLNHVGVEVTSSDEVVEATRRLTEAGLETSVEDATTCCYALQDKVWVDGPAGHRWEIYTVLADAGAELEGRSSGASPAADSPGCCSADRSQSVPEVACCG